MGLAWRGRLLQAVQLGQLLRQQLFV
jgi:hypothetical protein